MIRGLLTGLLAVGAGGAAALTVEECRAQLQTYSDPLQTTYESLIVTEDGWCEATKTVRRGFLATEATDLLRWRAEGLQLASDGTLADVAPDQLDVDITGITDLLFFDAIAHAAFTQTVDRAARTASVALPEVRMVWPDMTLTAQVTYELSGADQGNPEAYLSLMGLLSADVILVMEGDCSRFHVGMAETRAEVLNSEQADFDDVLAAIPRRILDADSYAVLTEFLAPVADNSTCPAPIHFAIRAETPFRPDDMEDGPDGLPIWESIAGVTIAVSQPDGTQERDQ